MSLIRQYEVEWAGRPALVDAIVEGERVQLFSLTFEDEVVVDSRGRGRAEPKSFADKNGVAFGAWSAEDRVALMRLVRAANER